MGMVHGVWSYHSSFHPKPKIQPWKKHNKWRVEVGLTTSEISECAAIEYQKNAAESMGGIEYVDEQSGLWSLTLQCSPHNSNLQIHEKLKENLKYIDPYKPLKESSIEALMLFVEHSTACEVLELF